MKTRAYIRISTDAQDEASQRHQITTWANAGHRTIDQYEADTASGSLAWQKRGLASLLDRSQANDKIVVSEISRIARSTIGVLTFAQACADKQVELIAVKDRITFDNSLPSKITVTILALCAEIERSLLRDRTKAALDARRATGAHMGRPIGSKSASKLAARAAQIDQLLDAGVSKRAIARIMEVAPGTLYAYLETRTTENRQP